MGRPLTINDQVYSNRPNTPLLIVLKSHEKSLILTQSRNQYENPELKIQPESVFDRIVLTKK